MRGAHEAAAFRGCALLAARGRVVVETCTDEVPNAGARFSIGSLQKQFTGLLVLELVRAGALSLGDPIERHLPELAGAAAGRVTVSQLLHMTSGLPYTIGLWDNVTTQLTSAERSDADFLGIVRRNDLAFEPGTRDLYSNVGYGVLAILVGRVSHRPWRDVLTDRFSREGMVDTGLLPPRAGDERGVVVGHVPLRCGLAFSGVCPCEAPRWNYSLLPGGGVYSTVRDLFVWDRALRRLEDDSPDLYRAFMQPSAWGFASGWGVTTRRLADGRDVTLYDYAGEDPGYYSFFARIPHIDATVIVLSSTDFTLVRSNLDVFGALMHIALGEPYEVPTARRR